MTTGLLRQCARFVIDRGWVIDQVATAAIKRDLGNFFARGATRHDGDEGQANQPRKVGFADRRGAAAGLNHGGAGVQPAIAQAIQKQRSCQPVLQAAGWVGRFIFQVQVNAVAGKAGQGQGDQVGVGAALVVSLDLRNGGV